jgi:transporter family protein
MDLKSLLIAGAVPTALLGSGTVLMKLAMRAGASVPAYLAGVGATVCCAGLVAMAVGGGWVGNARSALASVGMGLAWSVAIGSMAYGVSTLRIPVSVIAPLTNSNALVAVALSAIVFGEWRELDMLRVTIGAALIIAGATVVSSAA